jgi:hypothetical protein
MYDLTEAACQLCVSREWLRKQVTAERVACTRLGRKVLFTDEQISQIIADHVQPVANHRPRLSIVGTKSSPPPPPPPPRRPSVPPTQPRQPGRPTQPTKSTSAAS